MVVRDSETSTRLERASDPEWWLGLNPGLTISDHPLADVRQCTAKSDLLQRSLQQLIQEGYFEMPPVLAVADMAKLADTTRRLSEHGIPPVFGFVYDEFWRLFGSLSGVLSELLGGPHHMKPADIWVWYVDREQAGWEPHRDMFSANTLQPDGRPETLNVWIPLSDTDHLNGCMYVLPTDRDPNVPDNLRKVILEKNNYQDIRALPARAGSVLGWNSMIMHWGSRSSTWAGQPRISVAGYVQRTRHDGGEVAGSFVSGDTLALHPQTELGFEARLNAIRAAIRGYRKFVMIEYPDIADELLAFAGAESIIHESGMRRKLRRLLGRRRPR